MRRFMGTLVATLLLALSGCPIGGSSGDGGGGGGDIQCDSGLNTRVTCPTDPNVHTLTALQTLQEMKDAFEGQFPAVVWMGGIAGLYIDRDGKAMDKGPTVTIGGFSMEYGSGWTGNFCVDQGAIDDSLNYDTTDGKCTAVRSCQVVNCNAVTPREFPEIDTPAAIRTAFPSDPAGTLYSVQLVMDVGEYWTITRAAIDGATAETKKVDVHTGALIP